MKSSPTLLFDQWTGNRREQIGRGRVALQVRIALAAVVIEAMRLEVLAGFDQQLHRSAGRGLLDCFPQSDRRELTAIHGDQFGSRGDSGALRGSSDRDIGDGSVLS